MILKKFFEKLNIKKIMVKETNNFFENSFEKKRPEKIKNIKVTKIGIINLKTGEKFNQKNKPKIQNKKRFFFCGNLRELLSFFFFKIKKILIMVRAL